jgi:hypothetical protein
MTSIDALRHKIDRLIESMPASPAPETPVEVRAALKTLSDEQLDELERDLLALREQGIMQIDFDAWREAHALVRQEDSL